MPEGALYSRGSLVLLRLGHLILDLLDFLNGRHAGLDFSSGCRQIRMNVGAFFLSSEYPNVFRSRRCGVVDSSWATSDGTGEADENDLQGETRCSEAKRAPWPGLFVVT
jgi:hypothetical protein